MRLALSLAIALTCLAATACASDPLDSGRPSARPTKSGVAERTLKPGTRFTMDSGLTVVIPDGAQAVARTFLRPESEGMSPSDSLVIEHMPDSSSARVVMLYSPTANSLSVTDITGRRREQMTQLGVGPGRFYMSNYDFPKPPRRLFAAIVPTTAGKQVAMMFGGSSQTPTESIAGVFRALDATGLVLPAALDATATR